MALMLICVATFVWVCLSALPKVFTLDETEITMRAHYILLKGPQTFLDGTHYLAHPPLYEYLVALLFKFFGETEVVARGFGLINFIIVGVFLGLTLRMLLGCVSARTRNQATILCLLLYFLNPLLLQHSMLIDADTTGTALFTMIFMYGLVKYESIVNRKFLITRVFLALAIALAFLFKEVTPFMIFAGLFVYRIMNLEIRKLLIEIVLVFVLGVLIAWACWWVYCIYTGTDIMVFLEYTLLKKGPRVLNVEFVLRVFKILHRIIRWPVYWMSAPFYGALIYCIAVRLIFFVKNRKWEIVDFCWIMAMVVWIPFVLFKPSIDMMKYQHPIYPGFMLLIFYVLAQIMHVNEEKISKVLTQNRWVIPTGVLVIAALSFHYFNLGDYILFLFDSGYWGRLKAFTEGYYYPIAIILAFALIPIILRKIKITHAWMIICVTLMLPINLGLNWNQAKAEYTTAESWMNYGESGLKETIEHIAKNMKPGADLSFRNDIAYYVRDRHGVPLGRGVKLRHILQTQNESRLDEVFIKSNLDYIVFDRVTLIGFTPEIMEKPLKSIAKHFKLDKKFGDFKLFRKR